MASREDRALTEFDALSYQLLDLRRQGLHRELTEGEQHTIARLEADRSRLREAFPDLNFGRDRPKISVPAPTEPAPNKTAKKAKEPKRTKKAAVSKRTKKSAPPTTVSVKQSPKARREVLLRKSRLKQVQHDIAAARREAPSGRRTRRLELLREEEHRLLASIRKAERMADPQRQQRKRSKDENRAATEARLVTLRTEIRRLSTMYPELEFKAAADDRLRELRRLEKRLVRELRKPKKKPTPKGIRLNGAGGRGSRSTGGRVGLISIYRGGLTQTRRRR